MRRWLVAVLLLLPMVSFGDVVYKRGPSIDTLVPGLVGNTGNDETLQYIMDLGRFSGIPANAFKRHWYFSAYNGHDANSGSRTEPFRSIAKFEEMCPVNGTRCTLLDDGSVWSANQLQFTNTTLQTMGAFPVGMAVTWDNAGDGCPGAENGTVIGQDSGLGIVSVRRTATSETAPAAGDELCSADDATELTIVSTSDTSNIVSAPITFTSTCARTDAPCFLIEGENPDNPSLVDFDRAGGAFISATGTAISQGQAAVQNINCSLPLGDCFATVSGVGASGFLVALNVMGTSYNAAAGTNNVFTTHSDGAMIVLGTRSSASSEQNNSSSSGQPVAATSTNSFLWIGGGEVRSIPQIDGNVSSVFAATGGDITLIGPSFGITGQGEGTALDFSNYWSAAQDQDWTVQLAKISAFGSFENNRAGLWLDAGANNPDDTTVFRLNIWESVISGDYCLMFRDLGGSTGHVIARGLVLDECQAGVIRWEGAGWATIDFQGGYDDQDTGAMCVCISGCTGQGTAAACEASGAFDDDASPSIFSVNSFDSAAAGNGIAWSEDSFPTSTARTLAATGFDETASPATINVTTGDFTSDGFAAGDRVLILGTTDPGLETVWRIGSVSATQIVLHPDDNVYEASEDSTVGVSFRKFTYPQGAIHPDQEAFNQDIDPYTINLTNRLGDNAGYVPKWVTPAGAYIKAFDISNGKVGGR